MMGRRGFLRALFFAPLAPMVAPALAEAAGTGQPCATAWQLSAHRPNRWVGDQLVYFPGNQVDVRDLSRLAADDWENSTTATLAAIDQNMTSVANVARAAAK